MRMAKFNIGQVVRHRKHPFRGVVFDVDGVLVDSPHERAWRETLERLMDGEWSGIRDRTSYAPERFSGDVYQRVVAGKPRLDGARAALDHFGVAAAYVAAARYLGVKPCAKPSTGAGCYFVIYSRNGELFVNSPPRDQLLLREAPAQRSSSAWMTALDLDFSIAGFVVVPSGLPP